MSLGIDLAHQPAFGDPAALGLAARAAEQLGYRSLWVGAGDDRAAVAAVVAATRHVRLGVVVDDVAAAVEPVRQLESLAGERLVVVVDPGSPRPSWLARATVLVAALPGGSPLPPGADGWSPAGPSVADLAASPQPAGLLVPRVVVRIADPAATGGRGDWRGSVAEVASDVHDALAARATEVVVALDDEPAFDDALGRWARLAEAVEALAPR